MEKIHPLSTCTVCQLLAICNKPLQPADVRQHMWRSYFMYTGPKLCRTFYIKTSNLNSAQEYKGKQANYFKMKIICVVNMQHITTLVNGGLIVICTKRGFDWFVILELKLPYFSLSITSIETPNWSVAAHSSVKYLV